jgi:L-ascorbate metabolism protein UlaG (beta-lactamase superfamily)
MANASAFGTKPGKEYQRKFSSSPQFDLTKNAFVNRKSNLLKEMRKRAMSLSTFKEWLSGGKNRSPQNKLPEVKPELDKFLIKSEDIKVIWFGHSTFLLNFHGKIILVDPVFSGNAAPFGFMVKRFQKPVLELSELPEIDYIVISHDHYDHLDRDSIIHFQSKKCTFLTPLGVGSHLRGWGIEKTRIIELDWWEKHVEDELEFIATPAQHFSGRNGLDENSTLWASWILQNKEKKIYFSGDSGYDTHFKEIGDKYGPFDLAFIESGQYNEKWREVHMLPNESIQAYFDLKAKKYFPIHWGMFVLAFHSWYEPIEILHQACLEKRIHLIAPKLGELVSLDENLHYECWWKDFM